MFRLRRLKIVRAAFVCCALSVAGHAQETTAAEALRNLHARAGAVFSGQVINIVTRGGVVDVEFRVDAAIKGAPGAIYTLHEWGGLWAAGQRRYWVGERAMFFLRPPNASGFSSAVDGMEGVVPEVAGAHGEWAFDITRLRTRLLRHTGAPMAGDAKPLTLAEMKSSVLTQTTLIDTPVRPGDAQLSQGPR